MSQLLPGASAVLYQPTIFPRPLSPPPGMRVSGEKSARQGSGGGGVDCTPAPVSEVIFGCPLLLRVSRNRRMNQPMEEENSSSSLSSYEESEVVRFRSGRRAARTSGDQGDLTEVILKFLQAPTACQQKQLLLQR